MTETEMTGAALTTPAGRSETVYLTPRATAYDPARICTDCDHPAEEHEDGVCTHLDYADVDDARMCGHMWDGVSTGCDRHAPLDWSCAACVQVGIETHKSQEAIAYSVICGRCVKAFLVHCRLCAYSELSAHQDECVRRSVAA